MGKIFCLMGKSSSGKDTIFSDLLKEKELDLKPIVLYTTRPMRINERNGKEYFFISKEELSQYGRENKVIEERVYQTVHGPWHYATIDDGQIDLKHSNYVMIVTLEAYNSLVKYFGQEFIIPVYIEVEDGIRLERAINREKAQLKPNYDEVCRRFLADNIDFSLEKLKAAGIHRVYENINLEECREEIKDDILSLIKQR